MTRSKHLHRADKRLEYAKEIESKIRTWSMGEFFRLSTVHLALFMMAPMSVFQPGRILSPVGQTEEFLHLGVTTFPPLIRHFLEQSLIPQSRNDDPVNQLEKSLCLQRDGDVCVFTGDPNPRGIRVQHLNHRESVVVLEFHWMPKLENTKPMVHAELGGKKNDWTKMANTMHQLHASKLPAATTKAQQGLSIPSGKRIDIRMARTEAANFKAMIDLQWACITAAALSGVASPRMLHEYEPYWWKCDEGMRLNVLSWLDNID
ncbi:hypothetical protein LRP88_00798 [Fusarium phalaenopsidis]